MAYRGGTERNVVAVPGSPTVFRPAPHARVVKCGSVLFEKRPRHPDQEAALWGEDPTPVPDRPGQHTLSVARNPHLAVDDTVILLHHPLAL